MLARSDRLFRFDFTSSPVSGLMMMPMSVIPAATISSMPYQRMGLLATGTSCLAQCKWAQTGAFTAGEN